VFEHLLDQEQCAGRARGAAIQATHSQLIDGEIKKDFPERIFAASIAHPGR